MSDVLVVYFSRKGYVRALALEKARALGADVLELKTSERTSGALGFLWCGRFAMHRWPMPLCPYDADIARYRRVIVFSPVWAFTACAPIRAFLADNAGRFNTLEYALVHCSFPMRYDKTVRALNALSGRACAGYVSAQVILGRLIKRREFSAPV